LPGAFHGKLTSGKLAMLKETVYSSKQKFSSIFAPLKMFSDLKEAGYLGKQLFIRDTKGMFRQSFLGVLWAFIPPFFNAAIWVFLNASGAVHISAPGINYPLFVLCGTILFQTFTEAMMMPFQTIEAGKSMLSKLNFPREAFLITTFYKLLFNFLLKLAALLAIVLFLETHFTAYTLLFPLGVLAIILLGMSIGILLIPFQMLFQDFSRMLLLGGQVLMYLTPVVYPTPQSGFLKTLVTINPLTEFINIPRNWFNGINEGNFGLYFLLIGISIVLCLFGWLLYRVTMPIIVERIGA
jgi:lipopolysaccharide transport system permease protein